MPMSREFQNRLYPHLPEIVAEFGTPFHIYYETEIRATGESLKSEFGWNPGFREFFAVKALPNPSILKIMLEMGFGFDCSSLPEVYMAHQVGAGPDDIMFTSNNTSRHEYESVLANGGCILNLDDISFVSKVPEPFPELICFRYNPGEKRSGGGFIGKPKEAKYGVRDDQILQAYRLAKNLGAKRFGLHTMIVSNELDFRYFVKTVQMLLALVEKISKELGVQFEFINIGGGVGIPDRPRREQFDLVALSKQAKLLFQQFHAKSGYSPKLFIESGRYMTGPHGVLVTTAINRMSKHFELVGVDACMSALMRPAVYGAYHHVTIMNEDGEVKTVLSEKPLSIVGSLCDNWDQFVNQHSANARLLPDIQEGDLVIIHDTGAHGHAMGFQYNGRLRPKELLLQDGTVVLIRREENFADYTSTLVFEQKVLQL
ncbi:diaminopimelate decarboxylase [Candidatus Falkowbacteria bacterium RIFCSPLOWO2_12_FULL_45_10]|uniref:Diaminopimelate decarboxylase n=1 Tax=Candidatus Falkowbacteria bacterium RIFCSPLOWO2_12_FULL_45_10 TaxID=1797990 RepID=A0A1F5RVF8_9BACT|nr:MAG: diaminopimelate decarboxylase [Candidatus Falkowbacteria bacterium RIFCSPLOWO2_12_FULL_45_10]